MGPSEPTYKSDRLLVYLPTDDIDATLAIIEARGGKTVHPETEIPHVGWWAVFTDPGGRSPRAFHTTRHGELAQALDVCICGTADLSARKDGLRPHLVSAPAGGCPPCQGSAQIAAQGCCEIAQWWIILRLIPPWQVFPHWYI